MGFMNLDENVSTTHTLILHDVVYFFRSLFSLSLQIFFQKVSFGMLITLSAIFIAQYLYLGFDAGEPAPVPMIGDYWTFSSSLGTLIFNYAYIILLPSWLNEKKPSVSVNKTIWYSGIASTVMYVLMGLLGAWAYPHANPNILNVLVSPHSGRLESGEWHIIVRYTIMCPPMILLLSVIIARPKCILAVGGSW